MSTVDIEKLNTTPPTEVRGEDSSPPVPNLQKRACTNCRVLRSEECFSTSTGRILKTCLRCRETKNRSAKNKLCKHGKQLATCRDCKAEAFCIHGRSKYVCIDCGGSQTCQHRKLKNKCRVCNAANPKLIIIKNALCTSKKADKKAELFDEVNFIDRPFLLSLFESQTNPEGNILECFRCKKEMNLIESGASFCMIQRVDKSKGFNKDNTILACGACNRITKTTTAAKKANANATA